MGQVLSAYGREGLEAIIIVTVLLAKAGSDRIARRDVLFGALMGFLIGTVLVIVANDWADEHIFARIEGYSGAIIGLIIAAIVLYHAVRQHKSIKQAGFVIAFVLVLIETFEIGLQTIGVSLYPRLVGMAIAVVALALLFGAYYLVGKMPPTEKLQFVATVALSATSLWIIWQSLEELEEKNVLWFGLICWFAAWALIVLAYLRSLHDPTKHTDKM